MIRLSAFARNAPRIFYGLGLLWLVFGLVPFIELETAGYAAALPPASGAMMKFAYFNLIKHTVYDSLFLFGIGVQAEILLAIWRNWQPIDESGPGIAESQSPVPEAAR